MKKFYLGVEVVGIGVCSCVPDALTENDTLMYCFGVVRRKFDVLIEIQWLLVCSDIQGGRSICARFVYCEVKKVNAGVGGDACKLNTRVEGVDFCFYFVERVCIYPNHEDVIYVSG